VVKEILLTTKKAEKSAKRRLTGSNLDKYLGVRVFSFGQKEESDQVGLVTGLAWTEVGGDILPIEAVVLPGKGKATLTGNLGKVMEESIAAANSYVRAHAAELGIDPDYYLKTDIHVHVPDGATPKDGPSAGLAMVTALVSALTKVPVHNDIAMTGEVSLRGNAMEIGGLKEKLLAAHRGGIAKVMIPVENAKDLADIPKNVLDGLEIVPVKHVSEVLEHALVRPLKKLVKKEKPSLPTPSASKKGVKLNARK
jgi:ATP-dependent Lon protease